MADNKNCINTIYELENVNRNEIKIYFSTKARHCVRYSPFDTIPERNTYKRPNSHQIRTKREIRMRNFVFFRCFRNRGKKCSCFCGKKNYILYPPFRWNKIGNVPGMKFVISKFNNRIHGMYIWLLMERCSCNIILPKNEIWIAFFPCLLLTAASHRSSAAIWILKRCSVTLPRNSSTGELQYNNCIPWVIFIYASSFPWNLFNG